MITTEWIDEQITQRQAERDALLAQANMQIGELNGRIAQLEQMRAMVEETSNNGVEHEHAEAA